ncbi:MAG: ABC transporter ATP-binding protein [Nitrososphaerota archaeon]|nr:ABC transporter ATP-binding protein [Aigarchaeota archaeon]MDW8076477.1 ABC transporter ATP-binding protein [Nitrososphaerota archaeon]
MNTECVSVDGLSVSYLSSTGRLEALRNVSFKVYDGEFVTIVGPSGCGKTTLLNAIAGLLTFRKDVLMDGKVFVKNARSIGYVFQRDALLPWRTVIDNVALGLEIRKFPKEKRKDIALGFLKMVGLEDYENKYPRELSVGMRQRVALVRAIAYDPEIILMDEPLGSLDAQTRMALQDEVLMIHERTRKTVLMVTHDIAEAIILSDRVLVMSSRPGSVKSEYFIELPKPRSAFSSRLEPEFNRLYRLILDDLKEGIRSGRQDLRERGRYGS